MIKGTTPTYTFTLPFDTSIVNKVKITYAQDDVTTLEKYTTDCTLNDETISVTLTQEDTFLFDCKKPLEIQIRILTSGGDVIASVPQTIGISKCLDNEVLV